MMSDLPRSRSTPAWLLLPRQVLRSIGELQLTQTAASLAFLSVLALVPVFSIALGFLGISPVFAAARDALLKFLGQNLFLPGFSENLLRYLSQFAAKAGQLSLLGGLAFFATAFSALLTLDRSLNRIWGVERPKPLAQRLTLYWTFLTLGPLLLAVTLTLNGMLVSELLGQLSLRAAQRLWLALVPWLTVLGGLTLLYRLVPNAQVRWRDAFVGALVAALMLELLKRGLAFQAARLPTYTLVYGAFAMLPLLLIWLLMVWLAVLAGAVLAASLPQGLQAGAGRPTPSPAADFRRGALVLMALALAWREGKPALQAQSFREVFAGDAKLASETAERLVRLGYLSRHWRHEPAAEAPAGGASIWREWWLLAPGAGAMSLSGLAEHCWLQGLAAGPSAETASSVSEAQTLGPVPDPLRDPSLLQRPLLELRAERQGP